MIPVNGSDFEPQIPFDRRKAGEVMERSVVRFFENKGGTAYNTPFANKSFAEGVDVFKPFADNPKRKGESK